MTNVVNKLRNSWFQKDSIAKPISANNKNLDINNIKQGDEINFEHLPHAEMCQKNIYVGGKVIHYFSNAQFVAHDLLDFSGKKICSMIVNQASGSAPYLALSKVIPEQHKSYLCPAEDYASICSGEMPKHLYVREYTAGLNDWLAVRYELRLNNIRGTSITAEHEVRSYNYSLYVAIDAPKALEIERYPSGECAISATIFAGIHHVSRIVTAESREFLNNKVQTAPTLSTDFNATAQNMTNGSVKKSGNVIQEKADLVDNAVRVVDKISKKIMPLNVASANDDDASKKVSVVKTKDKANNNVIKPVPSIDYGTVRCNLRMASKLIDEALRSDMRVVDIMRKALGLSVSDSDLVSFDLGLSEADYKILADRFDLSIHDKAAINALIMEELSHFTGTDN